jgi:hypothetical protein
MIVKIDPNLNGGPGPVEYVNVRALSVYNESDSPRGRIDIDFKDDSSVSIEVMVGFSLSVELE